VQHAGEAQVVHVPCSAPGLVEALPPRDASTHDTHGRKRTPSGVPIAGHGEDLASRPRIAVSAATAGDLLLFAW